MYATNEYNLKWFELLTYHNTKFVVYGTGQWVGHIMDWAGCNYQHGRIPDSPVFTTIKDALEWIDAELKSGNLYDGLQLRGHHAGEYRCSKGCNEREVLGAIYINKKTGLINRSPRIDKAIASWT